MNTNGENAIIIGVLFILAAVTAIIGLALHGPIGKNVKSIRETSMTRSIYLLVLVLAAWQIGCTPYQSTLTNEERSYPETEANKVQIFLQGEITPTATEIGEIVVNEKSEEEGIRLLQTKAAEMGADGVINVEVQIQTHVLFIIIIPIPIHSYFVSGTAIKITKQ